MGLFDNVRSVVLNNKVIKSIKTTDGDVIYEKTTPEQIPTVIQISADNPIVTENEVSTLTITVLDQNDDVVPNCTLSYNAVNGSTDVASGTLTRTDNNGQTSVSYTGTGIGDVDFTFKYNANDTLLQETFTIQDYFIYAPSEVVCTSSNNYITVADLSDTTLPNKFILTFDYKSNYESRCGLFSKNNFSGNPNYSVFIGTPSYTGSNWYYGVRTTSTSTTDVSGSISDYHHFTIERDGSTFKFTRDDRGGYTKSATWFNNYGYVIGLMTWGSNVQSAVKNITLKKL